MKAFFKNFLSSALGTIAGLLATMFVIFVIVPLGFVMFYSGGRHSKIESVKSNSILHLELRGQLTEKHRPMDFELFGERSIFTEDHTMGLYDLNEAIDLAKNDRRIVGMYIEVREFDAGWASATSLRKHIEEFAATGKFVYAYADHMDELGYYLASAAGKVFMEPWGELEFNGLGTSEMFFKGLLDKLQLEPHIFRVGRFKAAIEPLTRDNMSPENKEQTQALVDDTWQVVRDAAVKTTGSKGPEVDQLASKLQIVSSETAKKAGLVTDLAFADEVEDQMRDKTVGEDNEIELVEPSRLLREVKKTKSGKKKVAVIFAEGEIKTGESDRDTIGDEDLRADIMDAAADEDVAAIVLRVNSPGGDALASDVIWRELRITDDEIPVVVSMGDVAASGGYYISSAARYIFAEPTTITGSIGVFGILFNSEKFFKSKTGISFDRVVTHPYADIGSTSRPMSDFEGRVIQQGVERVYSRFLDVVQDGRGFEKRSDLESIAEGRVWSGKRAKDLGLVDELGGLDQAIAKAAEFAEVKDYQIEIFPTDTDPIRRLIEKFSGDTMTAWMGPDLALIREGMKLLKPATQIDGGGLKSGVYARLPFDFRIR